MEEDELRIFIKNAVVAYEDSDKKRKFSALWCSRVVKRDGKGEYGHTRSLAKDMNVSVDTVENLAHAYWMFSDLYTYPGNSETLKRFIFCAWWKTGYIHYSHFNSLWNVKTKYKLTLQQCLDLLHDIALAEGELSSRDLDDHTKSRYGAETDWRDDARKLMNKLHKMNTRPDIPNRGRKKIRALMDFIGHNA